MSARDDIASLFADPWSKVTSSSIGLVATAVSIYGKDASGDVLPNWFRFLLLAVGLPIFIGGFTLTFRWAWDQNKDPKELNRNGKLVGGLLNLAAACFLIMGLAITFGLSLGHVDSKEAFARDLSSYIDKLDADADSEELFQASMPLFARCRSGELPTGENNRVTVELEKGVCSELLEARGRLEKGRALTMLGWFVTSPIQTPVPCSCPWTPMQTATAGPTDEPPTSTATATVPPDTSTPVVTGKGG